MRVIKWKKLADYWAKYPETRSTLEKWYKKVDAAEWKNPAQMQGTFNQADPVTVASGKTVYVFNIGRAHRLIAAVHFDFPRVFVLRLMTHAEYDEDQWKDQL